MAAHRLPKLQKDFARYRLAVRHHLSQHSMGWRSATDLELNLPFERHANPAVPYRGQFLLFHGLNDSPYVWRDIANALVQRGFDTRAVLFAGHGSTPKAMLKVSSQQWLVTAQQHLDLWRKPNTPQYLGGFSMGAVIATIMAVQQTHDIAGLLLVSPAYHSQLNHYLRFSGVYKMLRPWVFGGMIIEDNPIKYNSIPVNSGWQFYKLTAKLKKTWGTQKVKIPTLMVNSLDDSVVDTDYTRALFRQRFVHPANQLLSYQQPPLPKPSAKEPTISSSHLSHRLINQSHLGLMYHPTNPLFGKDGRVLVCNGNEYPIFMACMRANNHWFGAQHTPSPDGVPVARTTYNAKFSTMMKHFDQVFQSSNNR